MSSRATEWEYLMPKEMAELDYMAAAAKRTSVKLAKWQEPIGPERLLVWVCAWMEDRQGAVFHYVGFRLTEDEMMHMCAEASAYFAKKVKPRSVLLHGPNGEVEKLL